MSEKALEIVGSDTKRQRTAEAAKESGLHADATQFVHACFAETPWQATSATKTVWRKRYFRFGGQESGRVT